MADCRCGRQYRFDGCAFCPTCQPYRPLVQRGIVYESSAPSGARFESGTKISGSYIDSVRKRRFKKSDKTIEENRANKKAQKRF